MTGGFCERSSLRRHQAEVGPMGKGFPVEGAARGKRQRPGVRAAQGRCRVLPRAAGQSRGDKTTGRRLQVQLRSLWLRELLGALRCGRGTIPDCLFQTSGSLCPHCSPHAWAHTTPGESRVYPTPSQGRARVSALESSPSMTIPVHTFLLCSKRFHSYSQNHTPEERQ